MEREAGSRGWVEPRAQHLERKRMPRVVAGDGGDPFLALKRLDAGWSEPH